MLGALLFKFCPLHLFADHKHTVRKINYYFFYAIVLYLCSDQKNLTYLNSNFLFAYFWICRLLNGNQFSGSLPEEIGYLPNLSRLQIDENQISGPLPKSLANLNKLKHM